MNKQTADTRRVSERPGFIPLKTGDAIPDELRAALNVEPFVRAVQQSINQISSTEGVLPCRTFISK